MKYEKHPKIATIEALHRDLLDALDERLAGFPTATSEVQRE